MPNTNDNPANVGTPVVTVQEFEPAIITLDGTNTDTVVTTDRTLVRGVYVSTTLSSQVVDLKTGATTVCSIPGGTFGGTWIPLGDMAFVNGLTVSPDAAATGFLTVSYKAVV
jgi:hypothetical protein